MPVYKDKCPKCDGLKDTRAKMCNPCRFKYNPSRKGTSIGQRLGTNGYIMIMVDGKEKYQHRHIMECFLGRKLERHEHVHHIDGDKQNNDILNLELLHCSEHHKHHGRNKPLQSNNASGFHGVNYIKYLKKWRAVIKVDGKNIHLGVFKEKNHAAIARWLAEDKYGFHANKGK